MKDGEEKSYQPGPIRDCEQHDHLDTTDCDMIIVHQSEFFEDFDKDESDITCNFEKKEMKV